MSLLNRFIYVLIITAIIAGCSTVKITTEKPNPTTRKLDRVLIIAMTNQYETRKMYEGELSYRLRSRGYSMFSSVNVDKSKKDIFTKEEILKLIEEKNIDGVITMRLKDVQSKERYATSDRYISDAANQHNYFFNYIDTYYNVYSWSYQPEQTVVVEAKLFDAVDKKLIFQIDAQIKNAESEEERAGEITESFAKTFHKNALFVKKEK